MTKLETIKKEVLPIIHPTETQNRALLQLSNPLKLNLQKFAEKLNIFPSFIQNHGSTGLKQTHLRDTSDLDIFIGLNPSNYSEITGLNPKKRKEVLKGLFLSYVKDWFIPAAKAAGFSNFEISYAEHPYLIISYKEYKLDIVGCFDLEYEYLLTYGPITAVDRTPWHSKIIAEKLSDTQKEDVRLLKAFFQTNFIYGDKATLGRFGFTGFSAEILILYFQTIENVFSNFKELNKFALDFFNRPIKKLRSNKRFEKDFIIIIDPVDKNRNLAASISKRAYEYALFQIERFENDPSVEYFLKKPLQPLNTNLLFPLLSHLVITEFESDGSLHYTEIRDRLYSACEQVCKLLEKESSGETRFGKTLFEIYFEGQNYVAIFYCENDILTPIYLRKGPPIDRTANVKEFHSKHPDAIVKNGFYYAPIKREFQTPLSLVSHFFQSYKPIPGVNITRISQDTSSLVGQRAIALMVLCVLPLYKVITL